MVHRLVVTCYTYTLQFTDKAKIKLKSEKKVSQAAYIKTYTPYYLSMYNDKNKQLLQD